MRIFKIVKLNRKIQKFPLSGAAHPRLARGESYTCGYKPYRCEICNYSTTTKGNLSIHMQSDKHLNNVQELNNSQSMVRIEIKFLISLKSGVTLKNFFKLLSRSLWRIFSSHFESHLEEFFKLISRSLWRNFSSYF